MGVVTITVDNDLEDVVEIFSRLNSRSTRVTEADIYLGVVAARTPGWVRDNFLPFVLQLRHSCVVGVVGVGRVRFTRLPP